MAEAAGLVLAVAPIVVQAYKGISQLYRVISNARAFEVQLELFRCQILSQKTRLHNECTLLLGPRSEFDSDEVKAMLQDSDHSRWHDSAFQDKFAERLGEGFEPTLAPFKVICATLHDLDAELRSFTAQTSEPPNNAAWPAGTAPTAIQLPRLAQSKGLKTYTAKVFQKVEWSIQKKMLQALQKTLREQIDDLLHLREQRTQLKKLRFRVPSPKRAQLIEKRDELAAITSAREESRRLYDAIESIAYCPCHRIDFQLRSGFGTAKSSAGDKPFHLLVAPLTNEKQCTCVTVLPEKEAFNPLMPSTPAGQNCRAAAYHSQSHSPTTVVTNCSSEKRKSVGVRLSTPDSDVEEKKSRLQSEESEHHTTVISTPQAIDIRGTIQSLCALLGMDPNHFPTNPAAEISLGTYLGLLPTIDNYRHVLYKERGGFPADLRISLPQLFERANSSSTKKHFVWPCKWRYKLAYILASSMLHQSLWFGETWRSDDIHFLVTSQQQFDEKSVENPHISVRFRTSPLQAAGTCLANREWSFSLAIALLEVAYGNRLKNLYAETEIATYGESIRMNWDHMKEFYGAKKFLNLVAREMGGRYSKVVQRCFSGDFGIDETDLTGPKMQEAFYNRVVCELRECMKSFDD